MFIEQNYRYFADYQVSIGNKFALLSMFCESAPQTVDNALQLFLSTQYVAPKIIAKEMFDAQMQSLIEIWHTSTTNRFLNIIQIIKIPNQGNQLISDRSNFNFILNQMTGQVNLVPNIYENYCAYPLYFHAPCSVFFLF
jgi:hypothetical protein